MSTVFDLRQYSAQRYLSQIVNVIEALLFYFFSSIKTSTIQWLEPQQYEIFKKNCGDKIPDVVYFNKGL